MKGKLQKFSVKLLASMLAVIMSIPANAFAMVGDNSNTYTENKSVMGIQAPEETKEDQVQKALLKSELGTDESDDYIIEKSASLSKTTGQIDYIIKIINKTPEKESSDKQTTTFAITQNTDLLDLKVEKVQALDANGNEEEINYTQGTPNAFNSTDNIRSTGITTNKPQNGVVYYLSAKLTDQALKNLEEKSPQLALDFTIASPDNKIYQDRYALEIEKANTTEITIDNEGNIANPEGRLVENQESLHLYKGEYKEEQKGIFQSTPAQIIWTDYINAKDNKEFTYDINLDQGQDTRESQVKIEYYEAQEKGYVLNESFTKTLAFANNLKLSIPEGYIAKVELNTRPKENTKEFAYNGIKIPNPTYTEEKNEAKEEQASDDADPLPNIFSKNDAELNSSNDSITDQKDLDFSTNSTDEKESPTTHTLSKDETGSNSSNDSITDQKDQNFSTNSKTDSVENLSAIALNKDAYFDKLKADDKLTANIEKATNEIEKILEAYNKEEINWDDFKQSVQNIKNDKEIDESQTKDILASLLIGLNEDKYKVANIDVDQASGLTADISNAKEETTEKKSQLTVEEGAELPAQGFISVEEIGDLRIKKLEDNIRYSYLSSNPSMNIYDKVYTDPVNKEPVYFMLIRAEDIDQSSSLYGNNKKSTFEIEIENAQIREKDISAYKVKNEYIENAIDGLKRNKLVDYTPNYVKNLSTNEFANIDVDNKNLAKIRFNDGNGKEFSGNDAYLIKITPREYSANKPINFKSKWTIRNGDILDLTSRAYTFTPNYSYQESSVKYPLTAHPNTNLGNNKTNDIMYVSNGSTKIENIYCIQPEIHTADGAARAIEVKSGSEILPLLTKPGLETSPLETSPYSSAEELTQALKKVFYYAEEHGSNLSEVDKWKMIQYAVYYVVGGSNNAHKKYADDYNLSPDAKDAGDKVIEEVKDENNWDSIKESQVELTLYETKEPGNQNAIGGRVNEPEILTSNFKVRKVDTDGNPLELEKVGFTLYASDKETVIGKTLLNPKGEYFTNDQGELYYSNLPDGIYYLKETNIPDGYIVKDGDPFTTIIIESGKTKLLAGSVDKENFDSIINVSKKNTSVNITDGDGVYKNTNTDIYGNIDFTKYDDGTYTVSAPGKTTKVTVKDNKVVSTETDTTNESDITENEEPERAWVSESNYVAHGGYPDYMNVMDYSVVENPNTKQVTTYLMLKPDPDGQKNGTNKDTYLNFVADNSEISEIEFLRAGSGEIKETLRAAMENRNLENYFGTEYIGDTFENYESSPIKMSNHRYGENSYYNPLNTNYVKPNVNNYYISIPKSRFDYDESYIVKVVTNVTDTNKESSLSYQWASENPYEASLRTQTRNIPALSQMTKNTSIGVLDKVINTLLPTAYAADVQSDYKDVKITKEAINDTTNYIPYCIENIKDETDVSFTKYGLKVLYGEEKSHFLQGAEFKLQKFENGKWTDTRKTAVSDNNGQVKFYKLSTGEYQIIETKTASNEYRLPEGAVKSFKVENGKVFVKTSEDYEAYEDNENDYIYNELKGEGKLVIKKFDENGNGLNGVEFTLYQFNTASSNSTLDVVNTGTTKTINGQDGLVEWNNLKYGKYWIKETRSKDGYIIDSEKKLVTITKKYDAPTNRNDVSSSISIKKSYMYSTEGNPTAVYPNIAEGLVANLGLEVKSGVRINPGDYFDVKLSDNLDLDGVANVLDGSDGKFDIVSQYGTIAKAKIGKDRKTITYTFTNALKYRNITDMRLIVPMYPNRVKVYEDSTPTFNVTVGQSTFTKSNMNVYYSHYQKDGTKPYLNAYTYKLDPYNNKFTVIAYVNTNKVYSDMKQYLFEANVPVEITSFQTYRSENNSLLPPSYGIDFNNYRYYGLTYLGDEDFGNNINTRFRVDLENNNNNTYVIKIEGKISGTKPRAFETNSYLTHRNAYNGAWTTYTANTWSRFYDPQACGDSTPTNPEPDQAYLEFVNNKNRIEFTKSFVDSNGKNIDGDYNIEVKNSNGQLPKDADEKTAYFKLTGKNASNKEIKIPNAIVDGKNIAWEKLSPGDYTLKELAPIGFEAPAEIKFTVNEGGTITQPTNTELLYNGCYKIGNKKPSEGKFRLLKVDADDNPLDGVKFELTGPNDFREEKTSQNGGVVEYTDLQPGTYTLKETSTLSGYIKTDQEWTVIVDNTGKTTITPKDRASAYNDIQMDSIIPTAYAAEASKTLNYAFIVENLYDVSTDVVNKFNSQINDIVANLASAYGSKARITVITNGEREQNVLIPLTPVDEVGNIEITEFDSEDQEDYLRHGHLDSAIKQANAQLISKPADENSVFVLSTGDREFYTNHYDKSRTFDDSLNANVNLIWHTDTPNLEAYKNNGLLELLGVKEVKAKEAYYNLSETLGELSPAYKEANITGDYAVSIDDINAGTISDEVMQKLKSTGYLIANIDGSIQSTPSDNSGESSDAVGNSDTDVTTNNMTTIKVVNKKATYPSTGGAGTFVGFALIGTAIMLAGIAYFAIFQNDKNRRRSDRYGR